jgi:hypothetical protein
VPASAGADRSTLASCGRPAGQRVAIVDPEHAAALPEGRVGEIWVHGPNVAHRYWGRPERSAEVFGAVLADPVPDGLPAAPWLRTGDLGVLHDGELYITGRRKDLLIVAGRNHYPQDVEETVAEVCPALGRVAVFTVPVDDGERPVVVAELSRWAGAGTGGRPSSPATSGGRSGGTTTWHCTTSCSPSRAAWPGPPAERSRAPDAGPAIYTSPNAPAPRQSLPVPRLGLLVPRQSLPVS